MYNETDYHTTIISDLLKKKWWKLEKKYGPALDNYGQSCLVRSDLKKKWSVSVRHKWCPSPDHKKL